MNKNIDLSNYKLNTFVEDLQQLGITLIENQFVQFMQYYELLINWNSFMNLTAITEYEEVLKKHFIDSLTIVKILTKEELLNSISVIDLGTGAGFPGIPLKIVFPNLQITLLDSLQKRVNFLQTVIDELSLSGIDVIHGRAEEYASAGKGKCREQYDLCVSRAVANLSTLSEYCLPYVKTGGVFIPYKSGKIEDEYLQAEEAIRLFGGKKEKQASFTIPGTDMSRTLLLIRKVNKTPAKYPRKAGLPSKEPLVSAIF